MLSIFNTFMPKFPGYTTQRCFIKREYYKAIVPSINVRIAPSVNYLDLDDLSGSKLLRRHGILPLSAAINICSSSSKGKPLWTSSSLLVCPLMLTFCRSYLGSHFFFEISWIQFSCHVWKKLSPIRPLGLLSLTVFLAPLLPCFLNLRWKDCVVGVSIVASHLWLSVRVFLQ